MNFSLVNPKGIYKSPTTCLSPKSAKPKAIPRKTEKKAGLLLPLPFNTVLFREQKEEMG
jgi:hypothetical protein